MLQQYTRHGLQKTVLNIFKISEHLFGKFLEKHPKIKDFLNNFAGLFP